MRVRMRGDSDASERDAILVRVEGKLILIGAKVKLMDWGVVIGCRF